MTIGDEREKRLRGRGADILDTLEDLTNEDQLALFTDLYVFLAVYVLDDKEDARSIISEHLDIAWDSNYAAVTGTKKPNLRIVQ